MMTTITRQFVVRFTARVIRDLKRVARNEPRFADSALLAALRLRTSLKNTAVYTDTDRALGDLARALNRCAGYLTLVMIADGRREDSADNHLPRSGLRDLYDSMVNLAATILGVELPDQRPLLRATR